MVNWTGLLGESVRGIPVGRGKLARLGHASYTLARHCCLLEELRRSWGFFPRKRRAAGLRSKIWGRDDGDTTGADMMG